jgi:hypothetical protein
MRFDRESWRKLYVTESIEHRLLSLFARGLRDYLLRLAEADGTLLHRTVAPAADLGRVLNVAPTERRMLVAAVDELLRIGYLTWDPGGRLWITRFEEAQTAKSPGAKRQAAYVAKKKGASPADVTSCVTGDVSSDSDNASRETSHPTRRDETTTTTVAADVVGVPCPTDLSLIPEQRETLETSMIPGWAIDAITAGFVASARANQTDKRPLLVWRKCLARAVSGDWNNPKKRPQKPEGDGPIQWRE